MMGRYYEILQVSEDATPEEIEKAYKRAASRTHPDKNRGREEEAAEEFKDVKAAYECLIDPERRARYDKYGTEGPTDLGDPPSDLFIMIFKGTIDQYSTMDGFFKNARGAIKSLISEITSKKKDFQKQIDRSRKMMSAVKYQGAGMNLIEGLFEERIRDLENSLEELGEAENAAIELNKRLDDYQILDKEPPRTSREEAAYQRLEQISQLFGRGGFTPFT